jgi:hypothetical protein
MIKQKSGVFLLSFALLQSSLWVSPYPALASASTPASLIGTGTTVTLQNWQAYREFMSDGLVALFEGKHFWHLPPDLRMEVGPTVSIPLPRKYLEDTVRYSRQVRLVRTAGGGYVPVGYVAGLPFPHPLEGDPDLRGQRIFWDAYYRFQPRVQSAPGYTYTLDRYGNMTQTSEVRAVDSQLAYLSDPGYPPVISGSAPYYFARYEQQLAPEQGKYSTILDLMPTDPTQFDEFYEYVPTLRRSLRLSQAARCAPVFGSDYVNDDENGGPPGLPQLFHIQYLGEKSILVLEHATPESFESPETPAQLDDRYYYRGGDGIVPFPKPAMGKWEVRSTYVISLERLPQFAKGYCYSRRIMYVDKENYFAAGELDLYNVSRTLQKAQLVFLHPTEIPHSGGDVAELLAGPNTSLLVNFQNRHVTVSPYLRACLDTECAEEGYLDISRYASPEALMKIIQ